MAVWRVFFVISVVGVVAGRCAWASDGEHIDSFQFGINTFGLIVYSAGSVRGKSPSAQAIRAGEFGTEMEDRGSVLVPHTSSKVPGAPSLRSSCTPPVQPAEAQIPVLSSISGPVSRTPRDSGMFQLWPPWGLVLI